MLGMAAPQDNRKRLFSKEKSVRQTTIPEADVELKLIAAILDDSGFEFVETGADSLYLVSEAFPVWINVDPRLKAIVVSTYLSIDPDGDAVEATALAMSANERAPFLSFWIHGDRLNASAMHLFKGGLPRRSLLAFVRTVPKIFTEVTKSVDGGHLLIAPGEQACSRTIH